MLVEIALHQPGHCLDVARQSPLQAQLNMRSGYAAISLSGVSDADCLARDDRIYSNRLPSQEMTAVSVSKP